MSRLRTQAKITCADGATLMSRIHNVCKCGASPQIMSPLECPSCPYSCTRDDLLCASEKAVKVAKYWSDEIQCCCRHDKKKKKYLWYLLAVYVGPWSPVYCAAVKTPPKNPSTIEAQAKFFQYRHLPTSEDFDQGHRLGSERHFTERHERARPSEGLFSAKVRWGDKKGGYGEHYWDLNHAGHAKDHGNDGYNDHSDDGSYHHDEDDSNHGYGGSNEHSPTYGNDDYDPEKDSFEEIGRAKRNPRIKPHRGIQKEGHPDEPSSSPRPKTRRNNEQLKEEPQQKVEKYSTEEDEESEEVYKKGKRLQYRQQEEEDDDPKPNEPKKQVVLVVKEKDENRQEQNQNVQDYNQFVPYEGGAGVRQHYAPAVSPAASVPRLFLEPSTGHVVDRATGQAYVLQPIATVTNYNYN